MTFGYEHYAFLSDLTENAGGQFICPGRFIARSAMILTCALLTREFEMEVLNRDIEFSSSTYGFGTEQPKHAVQVRLRRRQADA